MIAVIKNTFQSKEDICWYCKYANPTTNNPTTTAISLTTFLMAYPKSSPPKNPPPAIAEIGTIISELQCQSPSDTIPGHGNYLLRKPQK
jgi:hypothetical protein